MKLCNQKTERAAENTHSKDGGGGGGGRVKATAEGLQLLKWSEEETRKRVEGRGDERRSCREVKEEQHDGAQSFVRNRRKGWEENRKDMKVQRNERRR